MIDTELTVDLKVTVPLRVTDFDRYGRLKPSAALALFQEAATAQAGLMNIGHDDMEALGVFWAVIRTYYEVVKQPELYTSAQVRTWPHSPSRFSFQRDYVMTSIDDEVLLRGTSEWVLMDIENRQFVNITDVYTPPSDLIDERNFERKPRKIPDFELPENEPFIVVPPYSAVDVNGHVNNSFYADYPFDAVDPDNSYELRSFQIDFRHEVKQGDELAIRTKVEGDEFLAKGINENGNVAFLTRTTFTR